MWLSVLQGVVTGAGLIIAIGAQNAFVLAKGLRRQHIWWVAGICALCDALLIGLGVLGLGALIAQSEGAMWLARIGGAGFLVWQAWLAFKRVMHPRGLEASRDASTTLGSVIVATLAVTLLNPQVYLDTLVMLGAIGSLQDSPLGFYMGATMASFTWFFGLVALARALAPRLTSPRAWQWVDGAIAAVMLLVAWQILTLDPA